MESSRLVVTELSHIKDLVMQLQAHLDGSHDRCKHLASQIFSLTERSIGMITSSPGITSRLASETPSPFKPTKKKRTTMRKHQVRVEAAEGVDTPVDDGHSWRKYGQKPILGSNYPRSYYRCRHRHSQGCPAMKKVQRADDDPTMFDVIYFGTHTCVERAPEHKTDAQNLLQGLSASLTEGLAAATEPHNCLNDNTTPFCHSSSSPATSDIADEFLDIDFFSSFFS